MLVLTSTVAQKAIQMEEENGIYKISCTVNGMKVKMYLDTGASAVSLSSSLCDLMMNNGYLTKRQYSRQRTNYNS